MSRRSAPPSPRPYWLLIVFAALMFSPPAWATASLLAAAVGVTALQRISGALRARAAKAEPSAGAVHLGLEPSGAPVRLTDRQLSAHGVILGASGAGKTTTLLAILSDHIRRGNPVVAIDMKGSPEFARVLADAAAAAGRPFRTWTPDGPNHWNPLQHGNATELKDKLIATERFTEPHYKRAAERYVQMAFQVLEHAHPGRPPTLEEVVALMEPRRMPGVLRQVPRPFARSVQDYLVGLTSDQLSAVRGLGTRLAIVSESHTGRYLVPGPNPIDLRRALAGEEVVLFSLNASTYGQLSAQIGALVIQDLTAAMGRRLGDPDRQQATVGIDEFSGLGEDHVVAVLSRGRESGVSALLATQEMADLDRAGRGFRDQVLGVTAVKIIHRQEVPASARLIAEMVGTEKVWERTYNIGNPLLGAHHGSRGSQRELERFVIHPNEIMSLPTGHAVVITKLPETRARRVEIAPPTHAAAPAREDPPASRTAASRAAPSATAAARRSSPAASHNERRASRDVNGGRRAAGGGPQGPELG